MTERTFGRSLLDGHADEPLLCRLKDRTSSGKDGLINQGNHQRRKLSGVAIAGEKEEIVKKQAASQQLLFEF